MKTRDGARAGAALAEQMVSGMPRPRLLVADDNAAILDQVVLMLSEQFEVIARVVNGQHAVTEAMRLTPDVLVLDISMPIMSGLGAAARLRAQKCLTPIVFLTVHEDEEFIHAAEAVGGLGYVLKSRMGSDLVPAVHAALAGRSFLSKPLSR